MSKKTKKNKKDIPVITWVDHDDVDDWIENNLQNMFRPTSSSSQKKSQDELRRDMQKIFDPSSSSYIEKRTEDGVSVISTSMTSNDKDAAFQKQYDYFSSDDDMSESSKERKNKHYAAMMLIQGNLSYKYSTISGLSLSYY